MLTFPTALGKDETAALRTAGFRFNTVLQHWEGRARCADAEALAAESSGSARRVTPPALPDSRSVQSSAAA